MIHAYASQANYWRHTAPIVDELRARGHTVETWAKRASQPWGERIRPVEGLLIVASWVDAQRFPQVPTVYVEHGAGQTYRDGSPNGYAGAPGLSHVRLFLAPGEHVAVRWRETYPQAAVEAVGCPALDRHLRPAQNPDGQGDDREDDENGDEHRPIVAITGHWRCGTCPETVPALPLYEKAISAFKNSEMRLIGHAHPRDQRRTGAMWDRLGIPFKVDPDVILERADLLVVDNSSLAYEAAACGTPVLSLNRPSYRRHVEHGLRFWSHVPGLQCDDPADLRTMVLLALADPPPARRLRERAARHVYAALDDRSAARAADAIERLI